MKVFSCLVLCLLIFANHYEAARILAVFPIPSISHQVVFRPLTHELARRGHDVTVITPDPAFPKGGTPPNLTEIDVHQISYDMWQKIFMAATKGNKDDVVMVMDVILQALIAVVDIQLQDEKVKSLINDKTKQFDLLFLEACVRPALVYSHIYKAPVIQMSSLGAALDNYKNLGAPVHPMLYPSVTRQRLHNLTMWEKVKEFYYEYLITSLYANSQKAENAMLKKHFGNFIPPVSELNNNVDMLFLNVHPVFEGIRPVPPTVVYMGGLHQKPQKELPADLKSYLDSSKNGVIYVSFGTNVDPTLFPADRIEVLVKTFAQLPYDILWKWNNDVLPGRTPNIKISKWLPQSDLLRHPKIKLFITQAGLQSTDEAITAGVPLIAIPMFGDQWYNSEKYEYFKIGKKMFMETLTVEHFKKSIETVINDESYRKNMVQLRSVMRDEIESPLERAVWWTEHVLRHGGARHLRAPAANMSWAEKHFGPDVPPIQELNNNVDMMFLNMHQVFEGIRPVPPTVQYMGGLHQNREQEIPKDLKSYLDSSKNGIIYLSFGTNTDPSLLPPQTIQTLVNVLSKVPYDVLWKWNKNELPGRTKNIRISKWLPQADLLKHPKIKLFITQGGLQSTDEAITAGVPLIGIPMLGDQWYNVDQYEYHKIGVGLDMETMTEEDLHNAIDKIVKGGAYYRQNLKTLHSVMRDQPQPPLERAVWWTEHVLRHGGARHLRAPAANMSWSQYLELELVFILLLGFLVALTIFVLIIHYIYKITLANTSIGLKIKRS
ncbi:hypothetical protein PYW07_010543 [Mythimna separata]|uniref:UDP-glucuronosyltransferase n=1 Tax=Mythimna separata TaxID=271217 RepID=A0AAD8DLS9_MYTSE|nr:hypothetical protein PYW07_010543 [Mythimna separata]